MATDVVFVVDPIGWERAFKSWTGDPVGRYMKLKNLEVSALAHAGAPVRTGAMAASIHSGEGFSAGGDLEGSVGAVPPYALFVHQGTRPHVIAAKRGGLLRFRNRVGVIVYAKLVHHPGTRAVPFLRDALRVVT